MSTGAYSLADVDNPTPQKGKGQYSLNDLDAEFGKATSLTAPPKVFSAEWFKEKADRLTDYFPAIGGTIGAIAGGSAAGPPGAVGGATLGGSAGESARQIAQRALGTNYNTPNTSSEAAGKIALEGGKSGATQLLTEGVGAGLRLGAPALTESALRVTAPQRGYGRTIGNAVLENTTGLTPEAISESAGKQINAFTGDMENLVHQATLQGQKGSTAGEHQLIQDAYSSLPRNAKALRAKVAELHDQLDLEEPGFVGPQRTAYTPDELLEMKRGIGKEIDTWPPEWKHSPDIARLKMKLYGSIDSQLDKLAPGSGELNQKISSLIPALQNGMKLEDQAGLVQSLSHRFLAHTGALTASAAGGAYGYKQGGKQGALIGAAAGLLGPELLASPEAQMLASRSLFEISKHPKLSAAAMQLLAGGGSVALDKGREQQDNDEQ